MTDPLQEEIEAVLRKYYWVVSHDRAVTTPPVSRETFNEAVSDITALVEERVNYAKQTIYRQWCDDGAPNWVMERLAHLQQEQEGSDE